MSDLLTTRDSEDEDCDDIEEPSPAKQPRDNNGAVEDWILKYKTTLINMFVCHDSFEYYSDVRHPSSVYMKMFYRQYGSAYELHVNHIKVYVTEKCLEKNGVGKNRYPNESVQVNVPVSEQVFLLGLKVDVKGVTDRLTIQAAIVLQFNLINMEGLDNETLNMVKKNLLNATIILNRDKKRKRPPNEDQTDPIAKLFEVSARLEYRVEDKEYTHQSYYNIFNMAINNNINVQDNVSNLTWYFKKIVNVICDSPSEELLNFKSFDCDYTTIKKFIMMSRMNKKLNVILHTKVKYVNKLHYRLNCFKLCDDHVWINSIVLNKEESKKLDLENLIFKEKYGSHYIINLKYMNNQELRRVHMETVKFVMKYIMERRDLALLKNDIDCQSKMYFKCIRF
ncbi:PxORF10 peptide [Plutella xylostella granulovirus]|uniref:PxGV-Corf10 protein n=1 Tax=Plutella xylostella granulovirus TaxID=98383 RepID=Q9DW20_9BBAC|nr:PxORF10 peptide [Plutella xylostella granulovirus]AAG27308.1 PxORF10 peptide [Plutella xylostella granulovirus]AMQ35622.1 PxGV-Corf10 protein [Plutella xylostella granulovirus]AMQ35739.1 PxGV-Korf10 protein [Plutella xylostella granulovirus]AMQ35856.1 PxGV-Morf10 protein [Plutella xylostella granulovirus]AMQ35973.1 PxGV-Torf10 protein [Plutella xylostella granulovirus]